MRRGSRRSADLADCLTRYGGADFEGAGSSEITVEGVEALHGATHRVLADRVEMGTYMIAPAIAGGEVTVQGRRPGAGGRALIERLEAADIAVEDVDGGLRVARKNGDDPTDRGLDRAVPRLSRRICRRR